jgi:polyferredoxin
MDVIKKISPENKRTSKFKINRYRHLVQVGFILILTWIGLEFYFFVDQLEQGLIPTISRPPGVESFLPISALISLKYWLMTGVFNTIHPSALVILLMAVLTALVLKKGFCSWVCPFSLVSEYLAKIHIKIFDRQFKLPKWLDYPLRSLKYILLFFFAWAVFVQMGVLDLKLFIYSPYNRVADIKMLQFFTQMSEMTMWVLILLVLFSLAIPYFWCRYLCPYGALLGAMSWLSFFKIRRNADNCIDCELCTKVCPAKIQVHTAKSVFSDECHGCLQCIDSCPVKNTLYLSSAKQKVRISRKVYALLLVAVFVVGVAWASITGYWKNSITAEEYLYHMQHLNDPAYHHNQGEVPEYDESHWQQKN